jgi:hypothetical protein
MSMLLLLSRPTPLNTYEGSQQIDLFFTTIIVSVLMTLAGLMTSAVLFWRGRMYADFLLASCAAASPVIIWLIIFTGQFH